MKEKIKVFIYSFIVSFVILMFTSKCSFLYPFNDWVDANAFFTMGKGMFHGLVPFKDLFEQKGPFLYLIYGIGSLISYKSFIGVFFLEVLSWSVSLYYLYKLLNIFISKKSSLIILPIFTWVITTSYAFVHGGSAEEFMLPFFIITMYYFFKHFKVEKLTKKEMLINGILASFVLLTKFTLLGFWIGFTFAIFMDYVLDKDYKNAIVYPLTLLLGMFVPFIIFLIYFGVNHAIGYFFKYYFYVNITSYGVQGISIFEKISAMICGVCKCLIENPINLILMIISLIFINKLNMKLRAKVLLGISFMLTTFFVFFGLKFYRYYILFVLFFSFLGLLIVFIFLDKYIIKLNNKKYVISLVIVLALTFVGANYMANFKEFRSVKKEDLFQYKYANIINGSTMLNMGHIDCGVYTIGGILPSTFYFENLNIPYKNYPYIKDSFKEYIRNQEVEYIVYYSRKKLEKIINLEPELFYYYDLIDEQEQQFENKAFHAYLFKVKEL